MIIQDRVDIPILLDERELEDINLDIREPVTLELKSASLRVGLQLLLDKLGLTTIISDEALVVTSRERSEETLSTRVYDCRSLIVNLALKLS